MNGSLGTVSKGQLKRMMYKDFDEHITRESGRVGHFARVLGATRFRKMKNDEDAARVKNRACADLQVPSTHNPRFYRNKRTTRTSNFPQFTLSPRNPQFCCNKRTARTLALFQPPTTLPDRSTSSPSLANPLKRARKSRSDSGVRRKKPAQIPGVNSFKANTW